MRLSSRAEWQGLKLATFGQLALTPYTTEEDRGRQRC